MVPSGIPEKGTIQAPIGHDPDDKRKRMIRADGAFAVTHYHRIAETADTATIELNLETGRTHQIRVHLASIGFPIIGDPLYAATETATRMQLHAFRVRLIRPLTIEPLTVTSPSPFRQ